MRLATLAILAGSAAFGAEPVTPPAMYPPNTWEGRTGAVVQVLDRLDQHVETMTIEAGRNATYKSLTIAVRSCLQHPPGLPSDAAALLSIADRHATSSDFAGWMFAAEPFVAVFQSPIYGVHLISCGGAPTAPAAPPLPPASLPPPGVQAPDANAPSAVYPDGPPNQPSPDQPSPDQPSPDQPSPDQPSPDTPGPDQTGEPPQHGTVLTP